MSGEYNKSEKAIAAFFLGLMIVIPIWCWASYEKPLARANAEADLATRTGLNHWWHNNDPDQAEQAITNRAILGTLAAFLLAYVLSPVSLGIAESIASARRAAKLQESVRKLDADSQQQSKQMGLAQSMQELVMRLGTIDQFIRVYRMEREPARQVLTLQAAHSEVTNLNAKLVSNELDAESLNHPQVIACVNETLADLSAAGLTDDRLCRDLRRIFKLNHAA